MRRRASAGALFLSVDGGGGASLGSRLAEVLVFVVTAFQSARLSSTGSIADSMSGDGRE